MNFKITFLLFYFLFCSSNIFSQSTERFIRIIGNSEITYQSDKTRVYFTVNEVAPNEYKKISYKPIEKSYSEFISKLQELGLNESQVEQTNVELKKYNKTKTRNYYIDISSQDILDGISNIQNEGFKVKNLKYLYTSIDEDIEDKLSLLAIKDAKRKANKICKEVNMKLGKILNLEDKSSGCCATVEESLKAETLKKYKVTITFELLD